MAIVSNPWEWQDLVDWLNANVTSLQEQWGLPGKLGEIIQTETNPQLEEYNGQYAMKIPMSFAPGYSATSGKPGPHRKGVTGAGWLFPKKTYTSVEMDSMTAAIGSRASNNVKGIPDQLQRSMRDAEIVLRHHANRIAWGDGTARLAKITAIESEGNSSKLSIAPVFVKSDMLVEATKWIRPTMTLDIVSYDPADESSGEIVDTGLVCLEVVPSATAPYIIVSPAVSANVTTGMWVCLYGSFKEEPIGFMGVIGDGTIVGAGFPRWGLRNYAEIDCHDPKYYNWRSPICNTIPEIAGDDPTAKITLTPELMDAFIGYCHDFAGGNVKFDAIITSNQVQTVYMRAAEQRVGLFERETWHPDLGFNAPYYRSVHGDGIIPIITDVGCPRDSLFLVSLGDIMPATVLSEWVAGPKYKYFHEMLPITGEDILRAFFHHYGFIAFFHRFAHAAIHNIDISLKKS